MEEENSFENKKPLSIEMRRRIESKKAKIKLNYDNNCEAYDSFIQSLFDKSERANILLDETAEDVRKIEATRRDSPLDNKLCMFNGNKRVELNLFTGIFSGYDHFRFKHIRGIFFFISKEMDKLEIEIRESFYPKGHRKKYKKGYKHILFRYNFKNLNENLAKDIIEWLVFKKEFDKISFVKKEFFKWK